MNQKLARQRGRKKSTGGDVTTADAVVLSLLAERPMHGYELLGEYDRQEVGDWATVSKAQVYYAIRKLADLGLITSDKAQPHHDNRDKTVYRPTKAGLKTLSESLASAHWAASRVAQPFATWLGLSIHVSKAETRKMLVARKAFLVGELSKESESLAYIKSLTSDRARAGELIVSLVIEQFKTELRWIDDLLARG